jgi:hypothetical protein
MEFVLMIDNIATAFGPHNNVYISAPLCLSALVADCVFEKTKPIYSFCVRRSTCYEKEVEKTNPICDEKN